MLQISPKLVVVSWNNLYLTKNHFFALKTDFFVVVRQRNGHLLATCHSFRINMGADQRLLSRSMFGPKGKSGSLFIPEILSPQSPLPRSTMHDPEVALQSIGTLGVQFLIEKQRTLHVQNETPTNFKFTLSNFEYLTSRLWGHRNLVPEIILKTIFNPPTKFHLITTYPQHLGLSSET